MQHILDAILRPATPATEDFAGLEIPESYRAADGPQGRGRHVRGARAPRTRTPASRSTSTTWRCPSSAPARRYVAVMASRDQLQHRVDLDLRAGLRPSASSSATAGSRCCGKRHDLPYHVVGSDLSGVVLATGPGVTQVEARHRGRRALHLGRARGPSTATTTRCSTRSSGSGASRPTSAAWPTSPWSRPTS